MQMLTVKDSVSRKLHKFRKSYILLLCVIMQYSRCNQLYCYCSWLLNVIIQLANFPDN